MSVGWWGRVVARLAIHGRGTVRRRLWRPPSVGLLGIRWWRGRGAGDSCLCWRSSREEKLHNVLGELKDGCRARCRLLVCHSLGSIDIWEGLRSRDGHARHGVVLRIGGGLRVGGLQLCGGRDSWLLQLG